MRQVKQANYKTIKMLNSINWGSFGKYMLQGHWRKEALSYGYFSYF